MNPISLLLVIAAALIAAVCAVAYWRASYGPASIYAAPAFITIALLATAWAVR